MEIALAPFVAWQFLEAIAAMGSTSRTPGNIPDWPCCALVLVPFLLILIVRARKEKDAKKAYYDSLQRLKQDPGNRALQAKTVKLAKKYIASGKDRRGFSDVDEPAIIDEIFAALHKAIPRQSQEANVEKTKGGESHS